MEYAFHITIFNRPKTLRSNETRHVAENKLCKKLIKKSSGYSSELTLNQESRRYGFPFMEFRKPDHMLQAALKK